jgi:Tat protein secretion system quality control protein TatD with DNase activity
MEMELYLGINGIITYKSAIDIRKNIRKLLRGKKINTPFDLYKEHFLLETDAPLLLPRNLNSVEKENSPALIKNIWEFLYNLVNEI